MAMRILKMVRKDGKAGEVRVYERDVEAYEASGWKLEDVPRLPATPTPTLGPDLTSVPQQHVDEPPDAEPFDWAKTEPGDKAK